MKTLLACLAGQKKLYSHLLEMARQKQTAIIQNQLPVIEALNKEEERLVAEITALESMRMKHLQDNPELFGENAAALTLEELKVRFPDSVRTALEAETAALMEIITALRAVNNENAELLKQALRIVNVTINTITGSGEPAPTYSKAAASSSSSSSASAASTATPSINRNLFDKKA